MPYYDAGNLFLQGEPSDLTAWLEDVASSAPAAAARELDQVYGTAAGRLAPFAGMLVVHELAHAFHDGVPFAFPRSWLMELFADMALYAFAAAREPGRRLHLETLPRVARPRVVDLTAARQRLGATSRPIGERAGHDSLPAHESSRTAARPVLRLVLVVLTLMAGVAVPVAEVIDTIAVGHSFMPVVFGVNVGMVLMGEMRQVLIVICSISSGHLECASRSRNPAARCSPRPGTPLRPARHRR